MRMLRVATRPGMLSSRRKRDEKALSGMRRPRLHAMMTTWTHGRPVRSENEHEQWKRRRPGHQRTMAWSASALVLTAKLRTPSEGGSGGAGTRPRP